MNLKSLRIFAAVMAEGSLKLAAQRHSLSESAASRQLKNLEKQLGLTLFERQVRQLTPTNQAYQLHEELNRVLTTLDGLPEFAKGLQIEQRQLINLVAVPRVIRPLVAPVMAAMMKRNDLQINLDVQSMRHAKRWVANRQYDLAIGRSSVEHNDLLLIPFCRCRAMVVLPIEHPLAQQQQPLTLSQLLSLPFIAPSLNNTLLGRDIEQLCQQEQITLTPLLETASTQAACALVEQGMGFTITDEFGAISSYTPRLKSLPLESDFRFEFAFYLHKSSKHNIALQQVIAELRQQANNIIIDELTQVEDSVHK
ncbi:LysR family transcriptional regulator [Ferrimonas lipolytica]|uniref:LysR family transcriptional regulator n=1 Tax=Ferrimonas lipolytica TaxID=2724191 RepID=A0A6H1UH85_9GAMM|nr:LysR family transcriptional regulator [Ferrimonas lipolytica]QIZ77576.1 LysR family transcriptional regulator [Ferrimonas lipolytica]